MNDVVKVLVVDDEEGMRLGVERSLRKFETKFDDLDVSVVYQIDIAESGEEAVEKFDKNQYELVLLDYKLPGISGIEVLSQVKKIEKETYVVMMTAYASLETAVTATKKGAYDFLAKPFTPKELRATVRKATRSLVVSRQAKKLAAEKRRIRFEFISVLSHELKAPISAVEGYINLIEDGMVKDEKTMKHVLGRSRDRLSGMRKLIFDLLDLTRIEAGTKKRDVKDIDFVEIVKSAVELVENQTQSRGINVVIENEKPLLFPADKSEMEIVFNNLVSNAVKYNTDGGSVSIGITEEKDSLHFFVKDTGIGMSEKETKKLFGEFVRIKNEKTRDISGSGLGLSTVKKIVQLYDGETRVESTPDEGSTFFATIKKQKTE